MLWGAQVARKMIQKYGPAHEVSKNRIIRHSTGPWKFTEIGNEEIDHNFPKPHKDVMRQEPRPLSLRHEH